MNQLKTRRHLIAAVIGVLGLSAVSPSAAQSPTVTPTAAPQEMGQVRHEFNVETERLRGATFECGELALRATRGLSIETTDADLRNGVARISISRIWRGVRLRGSDGFTYHASGVTAAWFVLHAPDFETPVHGLEVIQVMFRGGPDKSPGWLRERIRWTDHQESDRVAGPCNFGN